MISTTENTSTTINATGSAQPGPVATKQTNTSRKATTRKAAPKAPTAAAPTKAPKAATRARKAATVAPAKAKASKGTTSAKKAATTAAPRDGGKTAQVVSLLQRKNGVTLVEIMEKMGWQRHTVRGFMAGAMKRAGHTVESFKSDKGERTYRVAAK
jgi:hypothetical protein